MPGLMPPRCKMFDTPGVPHAHQLSSRLNPEEVSSLLICSLPETCTSDSTFQALHALQGMLGLKQIMTLSTVQEILACRRDAL